MSLYDPHDPTYLDPAAARAERDRTFQVCSDCRICVRLCPSFRSLFEMIDANEDGAHDVKVLKDAEHDRVVDECYQCKLCYVVCPYTPERQQEWVIDFPRLMLRSLAIQHVQAKVPASARLLARTDLQGKVATTFAPRGQPHEPRRARPQRDGEGHRHRQGAAAPDVRTRAVLEVVPRPRVRARRSRAARHRHALPHVPRRVPGPVDRQGDGRRLRAQRRRVRAARGRGVLRHAVARRRRRRQVPRGRGAQRRRPRAAGAGGQRHRRAAAHVRVRAEEGVPRLPRHRRRAARRRAHLRHVGVPARAPPRASRSTPTSTAPRTDRSSGRRRATTARSRSARRASS